MTAGTSTSNRMHAILWPDLTCSIPEKVYLAPLCFTSTFALKKSFKKCVVTPIPLRHPIQQIRSISRWMEEVASESTDKTTSSMREQPMALSLMKCDVPSGSGLEAIEYYAADETQWKLINTRGQSNRRTTFFQ